MADQLYVIRNEHGRYLAPCESFVDHLMGAVYWVKDKSEALRLPMGHAESVIVNRFGQIPGKRLTVEAFDVDPWELLREACELLKMAAGEVEDGSAIYHTCADDIKAALKQRDEEKNR